MPEYHHISRSRDFAMTVIDVKNLSRSFGRAAILKNISLQVEESTIYGLVGLNGAGKTTFIRVLLGLLQGDTEFARMDDGSIRGARAAVQVAGFDPWLHQPEFYRMIGVALESDGFFGNLNISDNLKIFASAKGIGWNQAKEYLDGYWGGTDISASPRKAKHLSRGQRVQCGLCRAFLGWPKACFFDEPTVSLDIKAYEHFKSLAKEAKSRGSTLLVSSHQLDLIDDICDRVGVLKDGRIDEINKRAGQKFSDIIKDIYRE
jgi:ABC-2 type transport system ATP-binding protein